jgi:peptidoglycan/xylan/chitin deacetylase (PgdA/CDA1 family)
MHRRLRNRPQVAVLGLHRILTAQQAALTCSEPALVVSLATFRKLLQMLRWQFHVLSLSEFLCGKVSDGPKPNCLITFDDAWLDTFENAYPALREAGLEGAVFVPTGLLGGDGESFFWVERLRLLCRSCGENSEALTRALAKELGRASVTGEDEAIAALKGVSAVRRETIVRALAAQFSNGDQPGSTDKLMNWEQLRAMSPVIEAASHTVNHVLLGVEEEAIVKRELLASRNTLQEKTGRDVRCIAYPSGSFNARVCEWTAGAGYQWAFTVRSGTYWVGDDPLTVPRCLLQEGNITSPWGHFSPAMFHLRLTGWR